MQQDAPHKDKKKMKTILQNNNYPPRTYLNTKTKGNKSITLNTTQKQKWATFTYKGK
jgi:hypothetical protein